MSLMAVAFPILPGKTGEWRTWMEELNSTHREDFVASRRAAGVHERTFLQSTPQGELLIVTLEGDDPAAAIAAFGAGQDEFTRWFIQQVKETHGLDLTQPLPGPLPEPIVDSEGG